LVKKESGDVGNCVKKMGVFLQRKENKKRGLTPLNILFAKKRKKGPDPFKYFK